MHIIKYLLAENSRVPKWVELPESYSRTDVTVSLFLHTIGKAALIVRGPAPDRKTLFKFNADWHEFISGNSNFSSQETPTYLIN